MWEKCDSEEKPGGAASLQRKRPFECQNVVLCCFLLGVIYYIYTSIYIVRFFFFFSIFIYLFKFWRFSLFRRLLLCSVKPSRGFCWNGRSRLNRGICISGNTCKLRIVVDTLPEAASDLSEQRYYSLLVLKEISQLGVRRNGIPFNEFNK